MMTRTLTASAIVLSLITPTAAQQAASATADFVDASGAEIGSLMLNQTDQGVAITGELTGIAAGDHGFHFHAVGECDYANAFESAGDHFNPTEHQHGMENPQGPHAGDLPNVSAAEDRTVAIDLVTEMISLSEGDPTYVFDGDGTSLMIHAEPDDMRTDPSGNSGDRIACAVVEAAGAS